MGLFGALATLLSIGIYAGDGIIKDEQKNEARSNAVNSGERYYHYRGKTYSTKTRRQVYIHQEGNKIYEIDVKTGMKIDITLYEVLDYNEKSKSYSRLKGWPVYRCHPLTFPWMSTTNGHQVADIETGLPCDLDYFREPLYVIYTYDQIEKKKKIYKAATVDKKFTDKWHEFVNDDFHYDWW